MHPRAMLISVWPQWDRNTRGGLVHHVVAKNNVFLRVFGCDKKAARSRAAAPNAVWIWASIQNVCCDCSPAASPMVPTDMYISPPICHRCSDVSLSAPHPPLATPHRSQCGTIPPALSGPVERRLRMPVVQRTRRHCCQRMRTPF